MAASPPSPPPSPSATFPPLSPSATCPSSRSPSTFAFAPPPSPPLPPFPLPSLSFNCSPHYVYLSFSVEDTRQNFVSHLYSALMRKQVSVLVGYQLVGGNEILPPLLKGIEGSKTSVVILSTGYASSARCLNELDKILECKKRFGLIVIPVFCQVHESDLRRQTGIVGKEFGKLEEKGLDKLKIWRRALVEVSHLAGFSSVRVRSDPLLVEKIIEEILKRLKDNENLVGVESCIEEIESLLNYGSIDDNILGIWGMGGIGKTAIASVIFSKISGQFESSFFAPNIREELERVGSLTHLRGKLFSTLFENKKILIVFDDVINYEQIKLLIRSLDWFTPGSLIIKTTRNKQVLQNCGVKKIYKMKELAISDALKLYSRYAFRRNHLVASYEELSDKIMQYTHGVPLTIKVLGDLLRGKSREVWEREVGILKKIIPKTIQKVLKVSYDDLSENEQNIFLRIACLLEDENRDFVIEFLNASGFSTEIGISVLVNKGLIVVLDNMITMLGLQILKCRIVQ